MGNPSGLNEHSTESQLIATSNCAMDGNSDGNSTPTLQTCTCFCYNTPGMGTEICVSNYPSWRREHKMKRNGVVVKSMGIVFSAVAGMWVLFLCQKHEVTEQSLKSSRANDINAIEASICRWITIPYTNAEMRCFGGKAHYNEELYLSRSHLMCPYGPVSRNLKTDLPPYCVSVRIPLLAQSRQVTYAPYTSASHQVLCYESTEINTAAVLLTIHNIMAKEERLEVVELEGSRLKDTLSRPLKENECVVVFDSCFIAVRNKGEKLFRGYRL